MTGQEWPDFLTVVDNPVTRFPLRVEPPLLIASASEYAEVMGRVAAYCQLAWQGPVRCNPRVIPADWLRPGDGDCDIALRETS
jgi:hypothetical protein